MSLPARQQFVSETIAWLDRDVRPVVSDFEQQKIRLFQTELQSAASKEWIPDTWFSTLNASYTKCFFFDRFIRRSI